MPFSQSLDLGEDMKDVEITPVDASRVKEYDEARREIMDLPRMEFERPRQETERRDWPAMVYLVVLLVIAALIAWLMHAPASAVAAKNATLLKQILIQGLA